MNIAPSLHQMLRETASTLKHSGDTFLIYKQDGKWHEISYGQFLEKVNALSAWLVKHGFKKGDRLALILDNCPEYLMMDQALMQIGGINVSIYPTLPEHDIEYIIRDSGSRGILAGSPFLLKKVIKAATNCPDLLHIISLFDRSKLHQSEARVVTWDEILVEGQQVLPSVKNQIESLLSQVGHHDIASLIYTSGTTGVPKGVILTHLNFLSNAWMANAMVTSLSPKDRYLSFLPLSHVYERLATNYLSMRIGAEIAFAQSLETIAANIQEVKPTLMTTVPRLLERMRERIIRNAESAGGLKAKIFHWAVATGANHRNLLEQGKKPSFIDNLKFKIADRLVFSKIRERLGGRLRMVISGGAALPQHVGEFFGNVGVKAMEGYGLTETSPLVSVNEYHRQVYGTVGRVVPGVEVAIVADDGRFITQQTFESFNPNFESDEGEIWIKGPSVMKGYWNKPEETKAVLDLNGWFHSGDVGKFFKGNLKITDRIKNMLLSAYGKNIYPTPVENAYLQSPKIDQIFLIGDKREFVTAIIVPAKEEVMDAFKLNEAFFNENDLFIRNQDIIKWIGVDVKKFSNQLAKYERVKNFAVKRTPFSIDLGEITPTLKTKRKVIEQRYADEIEALYVGVEEVD